MKRTVITLVVGFGVVLAGAVQTTLKERAHAKAAAKVAMVHVP